MKNSVSKKLTGRHLIQYFAALTATITFFCVGLFQGWGAPSLTKIMSSEYPHEVSEGQGSYIIIIGQVGHVIGGFCASFLSDIIGRKKTLLAIAIPQILSWLLIALSHYHVSLLYIARTFGGIAEGAPVALVPTYIAEVAEPEVRGKLGIFLTLASYVGILFINTIGSLMTIQSTALVCLVFPVLFLVLFAGMPESPYYLLRIQQKDAARKSLQVLRRSSNVEKELMQLTEDVEHQLTQKGTFKDLITVKSNRKAFALATFTRLFQLFTGVTAFTSYNQMLISQSTNMSPFLGTTIIFSANILIVALNSLYIEKIDRKTILAASALFTTLCLFAQGIFLTIKDYTIINTSSLSWFPVLIMVLYNVALAGGLTSVVNIYIGEIYSTSIKAKAISIGSLTFAFSNIASIKFYQYTADNIGLLVPFYVFGVITCIGTFFYYYVLTETRGKSLENIQREMNGERVNRCKSSEI